MSSEVEIGRGKRARRAYSPDNIVLLPARRTRDPEDVNVGWQIGVYHIDIPVMAAPMDSVMSPQMAIDFGRLDRTGVLDLNGLRTHCKDPELTLEETLHLSEEESIVRLQQICFEPIQPRLITERLAQIRDAGVVVADRSLPRLTQKYWYYVVDADVDLFVIRGFIVSVEHVSSRYEPLDPKRFIYGLNVSVTAGGVRTDTTALHLTRIGTVDILIGSSGGAAHLTRQSLGIHAPIAAAIADVAATRRSYMGEFDGRHAHVIANGGIGRSGDFAHAIACGVDAVILGATLVRVKGMPG